MKKTLMIPVVVVLLFIILVGTGAAGAGGTGTGGTQPRTRYYTGEYKRSWLRGWDEDEVIMPEGPGRAFLKQWLAKYGDERDCDGWLYVTDELFAVCDGSRDKYFLMDAYYLAGPRARVYDIKSGAALTLSDVFYDGFDYNDYINTYMSLLPGETDINSYFFHSYPPSPLYLTQPVSVKFDASTPFMLLMDPEGQSYAQIELPPTFAVDAGYADDPEESDFLLFVPLTHDISPWGGCAVDLHCLEMELPSGMTLMKPLLRIDNGTALAAEDKINAALDAMLPEVLRAVDEKLHGSAYLYEDFEEYPCWIQPSISVRDTCVTVGYYLKNFDWEYGYTDTLGLLAEAAFDLHTGEQMK